MTQPKDIFSANNESVQSAWVVFSGKTDIRWLRILKSGFRHCFVILNDGQRWMVIDPAASYTDIQIYHHIDVEFDFPDWLSGQGYKVVPATINKEHQRVAPCMFFTCVEAIKRVLGVHKRFILTPWQLYKFLKQEQQKEKLKGELLWGS